MPATHLFSTGSYLFLWWISYFTAQFDTHPAGMEDLFTKVNLTLPIEA